MTTTEPATRTRAVWGPNVGPQERFLRSNATEVLYGGQAGGGKSAGLLAAAVRHVDLPDYRAIIFRRTEKELRKSGGLLERAWEMYQGLGTRPTNGGLTWIWPSGARVDLAGMEHEKDRHKYKGTEFAFIGFDELTDFTELQYTFMLSRLRNTAGIPGRVRAASNPGSSGHAWVLRRWGSWLYPEGHPDFTGSRAEPGQRLFYRLDEHDRYGECERGAARAMSRTFIRAKLSDTPQLAGTGYDAALDALDPLTRAQYRDGDWLAAAGRGTMFRREWFTEELGTMLAGYSRKPSHPPVRIRYWDRAATEKTESNDPAATASLLLSMDWAGVMYVEHGTHLFGRPLAVEQAVLGAAIEDAQEFGVGGVVCVLEQDPGQAGIGEIEDYARLLAGHAFHAVRPSGDKTERAKPVSAACEQRRVVVVRNASWNHPFFEDLEGFPFG